MSFDDHCGSLGANMYPDQSPGFSHGYVPESQGTRQQPNILLMGLRRSGKSSIQRVVFEKMSPNETQYLESTSKIDKSKVEHSSFVQFQIWDIPGQLDHSDPKVFNAERMFSSCGAVVFVIDAQDEYNSAIEKLQHTIRSAYQINKDISFEVFVHKVDGLSDDHKIQCQRDIQGQVEDELLGVGFSPILNFYLTSIYDHSIFEAFSRVIQGLLPQIETLENLLDNLNEKCGMEKSFLFDVSSKVYVATDSSTVELQKYEVCSDLVDLLFDIAYIYGGGDDDELNYVANSSAVVRLSNGYILLLIEVSEYLALVSIIRADTFDNSKGLILSNMKSFKEGVCELFETDI